MDPRGSPRQGAREQTHSPPPPPRRRRRRRQGCAADEDLGGSASDRRPGHHRRPDPRRHGHAVNMGKSSRPRAQRTSNNLVADWLAEIPLHEPNTASIPRGHTSERHDRERNENPSPRDAERKAASRDPRHTHPQAHSRSTRPGCVPPKSSHRHHHIKRHSSSDCISRGSLGGMGQSSVRRPLGRRSASISDETLASELTPGVDAPPPCSPSPDLAPPSLAYVPRRPRHKVRHDKYETERAKRERSKAYVDLPPEKSKRSRKTARKHALASSKNVMNNWKSEAVLNDRITVHHPLRPGLFQNGREATSEPVQDLAFSPMNFLRVSKEKTHPKPLSEKRLRELERQQQNIEEESRFFAANKEVDTAQKPAFHRDERPSDDITQGILNGRLAPTKEFKTRHLSVFSPALSKRGRDKLVSCVQSSTCPRNSSPHSTVRFGDQQSGEASRTPTYISWSSSHSRSPPPPEYIISRSPSPKRARRNTSPGVIERAMMETGIFRGTRICDGWFENSKATIADAVGESSHPSSEQYPAIQERSKPASPSVSTLPGRHRERHRADLPAATKATQCPRHQERTSSPHQPRHSGRRRAKRPHSGSPESKSSENCRETDDSDGREEWSHHEACAVSKSEARSHDIRAAHLETRCKKKHKERATADNEADQSRVQPGDDSKGKAPSSNERESPKSRGVMPPPPLPVATPSVGLNHTTNRAHLDVGDLRRPESKEEAPTRAYERVGRGLGDTVAEPVLVDEGDTSDQSQNREIRGKGDILPLQSVSWIDPASRPANPSLTYNTQVSRVSTRPASRAAAPANIAEHDRPLTERAAPGQAEESMTEFIMRIESEVEAGMPEWRPHVTRLSEDEDTVRVDTATGQHMHYEASKMQTPSALNEEPWDPHKFHVRETYVGNTAEPYITGGENVPDEQDLYLPWDPHQYSRY